jgi:hypothetical protein
MTVQPEGVAPGKRYECEECGGQLICTKAGPGTLSCCARPMRALEPKPMPSAD